MPETLFPAARAAALTLLVLLVLSPLLTGCGQRGALYLPGQGPEVQTVVPETTPPADDEADGENAGDDEGNGR